MVRSTLAFIAGLVCLTIGSSALALVFPLQDNFQTSSLGPGVEYIAIDSKNSTIGDVLKVSDWTAVTSSQPGFGFDDRVYWLRFDLANEQKQPYDVLIELPNNFLDEIDLYVLDQEQNILSDQKSGDLRKQDLRPIAHSENLHPVFLPAGERRSIYVRVASSSSLSVPIQLWERDTFISYDFMRTVALGIFLGLLIMLSSYHLIISALTRDSSALYYTIFVFSVFVLFAYRKGVPASLISSSYIPSTQTANILAISLIGFSVCFFTCRILAIRLAIPKLAKLMHVAGVLALLPIPAYLFLDYSLVIRLALVYSAVVIGLYSLVLIRRISDGYPPAKHMIVASLFGIVGNGLGILTAFDLVPVTFTIQTVIYASIALMALFIALTLSYRINMDRMLLEEAERQHTHELDDLVRLQTEELENLNEKLRVVSITDGLTRLYNRRHFDNMLKTEYNRAYREKRSLAILLIDLDHFKQLNDTYGHGFGDLCLQTIGGVIKDRFRRPLDLAARYGGEEFVTLLPDTDLPGALHVAETLRKAIASVIVKQDDAETGMTACIGVAVEIPAEADQQEVLLNRADQWLYQAKHRGRNRVEGDR